MKASQAAYEAARIVSEKGHCKKITQDDQGRVCLGGAIGMALCEDAQGWESPVFWSVLESAGEQLAGRGEIAGEPSIAAIVWNNLPETTGEDVILLLKETGAALEAQGC